MILTNSYTMERKYKTCKNACAAKGEAVWSGR